MTVMRRMRTSRRGRHRDTRCYTEIENRSCQGAQAFLSNTIRRARLHGPQEEEEIDKEVS